MKNGVIKFIKQQFCKHQFVLKVDDTKMKEKVFKCDKCGSIKSEFY